VIIATIFLLPNLVFAHASLEGTTPTEGEVVQYPLDVVTFEFSTTIKEGSRFTIANSEGDRIEVDDPAIDGTVMMGELEEPLQSGNYTVTYEIISGDSHVVEGTFSFEVALEESDTDSTTDEGSNVNEGTDAEENVNNHTEESAASDSHHKQQVEKEEGLSPVVTGLAAVLVLLGIGFIIWVVRRKTSE
jgi:methionine-rich copper-binding protein CopC